MNKITIVLCVIFGHLLLNVATVPLVPTLPSLNTQFNDNDDDDTEIIVVSSNDLDSTVSDLDLTKDVIDLSFFGNALFRTPDSELTAKRVANYTLDTASVNPEELGSYLEGDILVPTEGGRTLTKNGITSLSSRWPKGVVPFEIQGRFAGNDLATIEHAMGEYHRRTCIRFVPRTNERDYISIVNGNSGCWSSVGRVGGKQEVNLQSPGCLTKPGTAMHELMHALGFLHEQNRHERDAFVSIQYQNIQPSATSNFDKSAQTNAFGVPYDYGSVMHYSANAFSSNGRPTIVAIQPGGSSQMGQRDGFSAFDVEKLNKMYNCGYGGSGTSISAPVPAPAPAPVPAPVLPSRPTSVIPAPNPGPTIPNGIIGNFLGGLISGLGLGEEETIAAQESE